MHSCPSGSYMKGFHQGQNKLTCCWTPPGNSFSSEWVDGPGKSVYTNVLGVWVCDGNAFQVNYHSCIDAPQVGGPASQPVMAGIHVANNWFTCDQ
jgi:hypothetical protein